MILRWMVGAIGEAAKGFHRLKGHAGIPALTSWLRRNDALIDAPSKANVAAQ